MLYQGSCHCGAVAFEIDTDENIEALLCNCSICKKSGFLHLILPLDKFKLLKGEDALTTYSFNTGVAKHTFCKHCGIKPFYTPRSNPDGIDINVNCLDTKPKNITVSNFDGENWEDNAGALSPLSKS